GISATNIVNGATRLQPCVLLTGQAAGAIAALSVKSNTQPRNISVRKLQNELLNQNAYLLPLFDIKPANPYFKAAQKIAATGILKTKGIPYSWANQTWFYPDTTISASELTKGLNEYDKHFVREEGQSTPLSVKDACSILESFIQNCKVSDSILSVNGIKSSNEGEIIRWAENHWHEISSVSFNAERNIRKIEVAVLLDKLIDPFNQKDVDLTGNFK
ncbi:MAG: FAD-dependent oxidoreductase, partial [Bacteroidota bacterium]|nr:FAD-dependent oxidoreductase [Bacteroidota bacterium]